MYNPNLALQMAKNFKKDVVSLKKEIKSLPSQLVAQKNALKNEWGSFQDSMRAGLDPKFATSLKSGAIKTRIAASASPQARQAMSLSRGVNIPNLASAITTGKLVSEAVNLDSFLNMTTKMIIQNGPRKAPAWATSIKNVLSPSDPADDSGQVTINSPEVAQRSEISAPSTAEVLQAANPIIVPTPIEQMKTDAASLSVGDWRQAALLKEVERLEQQRLMQIAIDAPIIGGYRSQLKFDD
jgi:hypothetical protein